MSYPEVMAGFRNQIGSFSTIFAFEAAARHGSFTAAAGELGVSQAAVSKQIAALEERLGVALFFRRPRHVELTPAGRQLAASSHTALSSIAGTMQEIRKVEARSLTVKLSASLSRFWLVERMPDFRRTHPDIVLRIVTQDTPGDHAANNADLLIRYQTTVLPGSGAIRLFGARIAPMASPGFLERHPVRRPEDIALAPLIYYDTPDSEWVSWEDWQRIALPGKPLPPPSFSVSRYHDAFAAAQQGQGIILAWQVENGSDRSFEGLREIPAPKIAAPGAFYLIPLTPARLETRAAIEWLKLQSSGQRRTQEI